ncbi:MAG: SRPBCC domain-containing protein [Myxococcales bacterium]|nr:SRPBCC domain-containing protein [Myxococcales bacterium]
MPNKVKLHRVLAARPEKVDRAFLEPDAAASWLPPFGFVCTVHELEAKEGGRHHMSFRNFTTGNSHAFGGTQTVLQQAELLSDYWTTRPAW